MKAAFYTLGCKVNQYDTQEMISALKGKGWEIVDAKEKADVYIVNSCTVTAESSRKTKQAVRRLKTDNPEALIVLTGCYPQAFGEEASKLAQADVVLGNRTNFLLEEEIQKYFETKRKTVNIKPHDINDKYNGKIISSFEDRTRAFIKIQDGCNRRCSYCILPKARGFSRSKPLDEIKKEVGLLAANGYREIVFVGVDLSSYGAGAGLNICDALNIAEQTDGIERIRLGSLEPDLITDQIIDGLGKISKFCPQFHLSLQSGCNEILRRMNRHYTAQEFFELCVKLKNAFPDISLTTDIIVGFPGETEKNFRETTDIVKKCGFMKTHIFPFSPREGTRAYNYPDRISNAEKAKRCARLQKICDKIRADFLKSYLGKSVNVLFEMPKGERQTGYTENYIPVSLKSDTDLSGKILRVKIIGTDDSGCQGETE